jgi:hypothetical protein
VAREFGEHSPKIDITSTDVILRNFASCSSRGAPQRVEEEKHSRLHLDDHDSENRDRLGARQVAHEARRNGSKRKNTPGFI